MTEMVCLSFFASGLSDLSTYPFLFPLKNISRITDKRLF